MKKMYVICGEIDSGKTHTMWLVLCHLLEKGAKLLEMYPAKSPLEYEKIMSTKAQIPDFRALVEWHGKKIMLLSAGDYLWEWRYWGFRIHIKWAIRYEIDYVVCCARSRNKKGSVHKELMDVYRGNVLDDEDWFWVEKVDQKVDWLKARDITARQIADRLLKNID